MFELVVVDDSLMKLWYNPIQLCLIRVAEDPTISQSSYLHQCIRQNQEYIENIEESRYYPSWVEITCNESKYGIHPL